jgi:hypothetical protein
MTAFHRPERPFDKPFPVRRAFRNERAMEACRLTSPHPSGIVLVIPMTPENSDSPVTTQAIDNLALSVTEAADQIAVLRDAIDELRDNFTWAVRNKRLSAGVCPVLKRMAADPSATDWTDRLEIVRGSTDSNPPALGPKQMPSIVDRLLDDAQQVVSRLMEVREFLSGQFSGTQRPSPDENVRTRTSGRERLQRRQQRSKRGQIDPAPTDAATAREDALKQRDSQPSSAKTPGTRVPIPKPPPGKLFSEPGDQQRLF